MTLQELEDQILALSASEKAEVLQILTTSLGKGSKGISKTLGVCGGEACIANTRIPVWVLVEARQLGISEKQLLDDYPQLTALDLVIAWIYAKVHPEEIAQTIQKNQEV